MGYYLCRCCGSKFEDGILLYCNAAMGNLADEDIVCPTCGSYNLKEVLETDE